METRTIKSYPPNLILGKYETKKKNSVQQLEKKILFSPSKNNIDEYKKNSYKYNKDIFGPTKFSAGTSDIFFTRRSRDLNKTITLDQIILAKGISITKDLYTKNDNGLIARLLQISISKKTFTLVLKGKRENINITLDYNFIYDKIINDRINKPSEVIYKTIFSSDGNKSDYVKLEDENETYDVFEWGLNKYADNYNSVKYEDLGTDIPINAIVVYVEKKQSNISEWKDAKELYDEYLLPLKICNNKEGQIKTRLVDSEGNNFNKNIYCVNDIKYNFENKNAFVAGEALIEINVYARQKGKDSTVSNLKDDCDKETIYVISESNINIHKRKSIDEIDKLIFDEQAPRVNIKTSIYMARKLNEGLIFASAEIVDKLSITVEKFNKMKNFIDKYSVKNIQDTTNENIAPRLLNEEHFYNEIAGATPNIKVSFKGLDGNFTEELDTLNYPFIKSVSVEDAGVKTVKLVLWDKDFGSYYKKNRSLEQIIRDAISANEVKISSSQQESGNLLDELSFAKIEKMDPCNMKLFIGYTDWNQEWEQEITDEYKKIASYNNPDSMNKRTHRYWEIKEKVSSNVDVASDTEGSQKIFNIYTNVSNPGDMIEKEVGSNTVTVRLRDNNFKNTSNDFIDRYNQVIRTRDNTTYGMNTIELMIINLKTKLTDNGVEYEIEAVESKASSTLDWSIVQRYEELYGTPTEVLYMLMRMFNENTEGRLTNSPIRLYWGDKQNIVEELDYEYYKQNPNTEVPLQAAVDGTTVNKKIAVSLGGQAAYNNYKEKNNENKHLSYKNVKQILDEFCAACPPYIENKIENRTYIDAYGETKTLENAGGNIVRPLTWTQGTVTFDDNHKETCIFFYYRKIIKPEVIREYNWGPANTGNTVIKSINIENANEFAVLSSRSTFDIDSNLQTTYRTVTTEEVQIDNIENIGSTTKQDVEGKIIVSESKSWDIDKLGVMINRVTGGPVKNAIENAYSNCLYKGTITIMGDPFYSFDELMTPASYPIRLNILVPRSEFELGSNSNSDIYFGGENGLSRKHYLSGYYVITKINHSISSSGFETVLEVMSYPGIEHQLGLIKDDKLISFAEKSLSSKKAR